MSEPFTGQLRMSNLAGQISAFRGLDNTTVEGMNEVFKGAGAKLAPFAQDMIVQFPPRTSSTLPVPIPGPSSIATTPPFPAAFGDVSRVTQNMPGLTRALDNFSEKLAGQGIIIANRQAPEKLDSSGIGERNALDSSGIGEREGIIIANQPIFDRALNRLDNMVSLFNAMTSLNESFSAARTARLRF
jgi:hypothetical protein